MRNINYKGGKKHTLFLPLSVSVMDNCSIVPVIHVFWTRCGGLNVSEFPSRSSSLHAAVLLQARDKKKQSSELYLQNHTDQYVL